MQPSFGVVEPASRQFISVTHFRLGRDAAPLDIPSAQACRNISVGVTLQSQILNRLLAGSRNRQREVQAYPSGLKSMLRCAFEGSKVQSENYRV